MGPMVADEVAKVIGAADIPALADHAVKTAGGERREFLQRLADEREVAVDARWTQRRA